MRIPYPYLDHWHRHAYWFNPCCALLNMLLCCLCLLAYQTSITSTCQNNTSAQNTPPTQSSAAVPQALQYMPPRTPMPDQSRPCPDPQWIPQAEQLGIHWQHWQQNAHTFSSQQTGTLNGLMAWLQTLNQQGIQPQSIIMHQTAHHHQSLQLQLQLDCTHDIPPSYTMANP